VLAFYAARPYIRRLHMPAEPATPEKLLREKLVTLIDTGLTHMLETGSAEPGWMRLVSDATATLGALDARLKSKDTA
jgi:hypothetical protein